MNKNDNILIVYFTWSGNTRKIAEKIHQIIGGDLVEVKSVISYSKNYNTCIAETKIDKHNQARPRIKINIHDFTNYNNIFLGYPNWWSSIPMPIASFLEKYDFTQKTIIPFCSHGGGRQGQSISAITRLIPQAKIIESLPVYYSGGNSLQNDILTWLGKIGMTVK